MKKLLFLLFLPLVMQAQNTPILTQNGVEDVIVLTDTLTAQQLYSNTLNWVNVNYKNPDQVIKASIPNEMLRIEGFQSGFFEMKALGIPTYYDVSYTVTFNFKAGRYKFGFTVNEATNKGRKLTFSEENFFKRKDGSVRKMYSLAHSSFNASLEALFLSHYNYVIGSVSEDDGW